MTDPIENAARLLREEAQLIKRDYATQIGAGDNRAYAFLGEPDAEAKYDELVNAADALDEIKDS